MKHRLLAALFGLFLAASAFDSELLQNWPTKKWKESGPEEQGMDSALLREANAHIEKELPNLYSLLVVRHGYIVFERYYHGSNKDTPQQIASATKAILSALVGIAIREHHLRSVEQRLPEFFPEFFAKETDPRKKEISLRHLLTMTSGLSLDFRTTVKGMEQSSDWVGFVLGRPMAFEPGQQFVYGGATHLLSVILSRAARMNTREFAERKLFQPLGIVAGEWPTDPQGFSDGTHGLHLTARDMAQFGYLFLNGGVWERKQIVPAEWVSESTKKRNEGGFPENAGYGYMWWISQETGYTAYFAAGYGGQYIYVIPDLDMVVVMIGASNIPVPALRDHRHLIREFIAPAARLGKR